MGTFTWYGVWDARHPSWEQLDLAELRANSQLRACDEHGEPYQLDYALQWDTQWRLRAAQLQVEIGDRRHSLKLSSDGQGHWRDGIGLALDAMHGCLDIDIWPTPFTNSLPIRRLNLLRDGERAEIRVLFIEAPQLTMSLQHQAYTRLDRMHYRFEDFSGSGFSARLQVDTDGIILDYPTLFRRAL